MAKTKSKMITIEDALVPVDEQPYEVPENWCWTTLDQVCFFENGYAFKSDKFSDNGIPVIRISNIFDNEVSIEGCVYTTEENIDDRFIIKNGDLLIAMSGATTGKNGVFLSYQKAYLNQRVGNIKVINHNVLLEGFRNYYIASKQEEILRNAYGGAQPNISSTKIGKMLFPLPPFQEQQRIVEQIESLFSKLDEAKEKAQGILNSFDDTWSAITYAAFTGRLTEKWREKNGKKSDWKEYTLQGVCIMKITDGTHQTPTYCEKEDGGVPFISAKDVTSKTICWDDIKYIIPELHEELYARIAPQIDDVLLAKNGTTGVAAIVDTDKVFDIYVTLAVLRPDKDIIVPRYLYNIVNSPVCKDQFNSHLTGIGVPNLHLRDIKDVKIMVPDKDEQIEVVRLVDRLWDTHLTAYETAKGVVESIDIMKKSILARAFRGELGTNDSSEESSIELLKQVLEKG